MATVPQYLYSDAIDHLVDFAGADVGQEVYRHARAAILSAYRKFTNEARWTYLYRVERLNCVAPQSTGTVAYTQSTNTLTLTGATWPSWASLGSITINNVRYDVATVPTTTTLTLTSNTAPPADIAAGTPYMLYQDTYALPSDFLAAEEFINTNNYFRLIEESPAVWLKRQRILHSPATPHVYCFRGDPHYFGSMAVSFFPPPDQAYQFDFLYQRRPRPLLVDNYGTGTVSCTNGSAVLTGTGTSWTSKHAGSIVRLGGDGLNAPTGLTGLNVFVTERTAVSVDSATQITVDATFADTLTGVKYTLSDPIDMDQGTMLTGFLRCCEMELGILRKMKDRDDLRSIYHEELKLAREADSRSFRRRVENAGPYDLYRLRDFPRGPDVS